MIRYEYETIGFDRMRRDEFIKIRVDLMDLLVFATSYRILRLIARPRIALGRLI